MMAGMLMLAVIVMLGSVADSAAKSQGTVRDEIDSAAKGRGTVRDEIDSAAKSQLGQVRDGRAIPKVKCLPGQYQTHKSHYVRCEDCLGLCFMGMDTFTAQNCRRRCPATYDNLMKPPSTPSYINTGTDVTSSPVHPVTTMTMPAAGAIHGHEPIYYVKLALNSLLFLAVIIVICGIVFAVRKYKRRKACRKGKGHKQPDVEDPEDPRLRMCEFVPPEDRPSVPSTNLIIPGSLPTSSV